MRFISYFVILDRTDIDQILIDDNISYDIPKRVFENISGVCVHEWIVLAQDDNGMAAAGNMITGYAEQEQEQTEAKDWCAECGKGFWNVCGPEECLVLSRQQINESSKKGKCAYSTNKCTFTDYDTNMCGKCVL